MKRASVLLWILLLLGSTGCSLTLPFAERSNNTFLSADGSPGRWEIEKKIDFHNIPAADMKGEIRLIDQIYLVSAAGFYDESYGITVGPDDDVRFTTDGGRTWTKSSPELHCRNGLDIVDTKVAWHCGNGGTRVSTDGGRTWRTVAPSPCASLSFLSSQTGWAASPFLLAATADGGETWNRLNPPVGRRNIVAIALRTVEDGYVLDEEGNLLVTADGGRSWETHSLGLKAGLRLMDSAGGSRTVMRFLDAENGGVVFDLVDRSVWFAATEDGGRNWKLSEITELRNQSSYYHLFLSPDGRLLTATDKFSGKNYSVVLRHVMD
jgi:photosystem II stability/assembly factor-like uncharacterized protein